MAEKSLNLIYKYNIGLCASIGLTCGQSYKHFTLINYDSKVVIWRIFQSGTTLES